MDRMTHARALEINTAMVDAFMIRDGLRQGRPECSFFTVEEAVESSVMMRVLDLGRQKLPDGSTRLSCMIEPSRVVELYHWARSARLDVRT